MRNWLNSNWLELLITILVAVIDVAMITPWLVLLIVSTGGTGIDPAVPIGLVVIGVVSFWVARELLSQMWDMAAMRMISLGAWLLMIVVWYGVVTGSWLAAPLQFIDRLVQFDGQAIGLLLLGGLGWWRGVWLASTEDIFESDFIRAAVMRTIVFHGVILVVAAVVWEDVRTPVLSAAVIMVPLGFAACLIAATAIQVKSARHNIQEEPGEQPPAGGWLGVGAVITGAVLLISGLIAGTAGREVWQLLFWPFTQVLRAFSWLLDWIILGIALIGYAIMLPIFWVVQQLIQDREEEDFAQETAEDPVFERDDLPAGADFLPEWALQILQVVVVVAIVALIAWFALRQLRRLQRRTREVAANESRESMLSTETLLNDLGALFRGLRGRWGSRRERIDLRQPPETVRDAYRYTLVHAGRQGYHRDRRESPLKYSGRLKTTDPDLSDPLDDLTERYQRARYGDQTSDEDVRISREDWDAIRQRLRRREQRESGE